MRKPATDARTRVWRHISVLQSTSFGSTHSAQILMAKHMTDSGTFHEINTVEQSWIQVLYGGMATCYFQVMSTNTSGLCGLYRVSWRALSMQVDWLGGWKQWSTLWTPELSPRDKQAVYSKTIKYFYRLKQRIGDIISSVIPYFLNRV
jgi:hypothetical protein